MVNLNCILATYLEWGQKRKKDYTKAEKYLNYFSEHDPMKSHYQGRLLQKQGKIKEAYEKYENIIFFSNDRNGV